MTAHPTPRDKDSYHSVYATSLPGHYPSFPNDKHRLDLRRPAAIVSRSVPLMRFPVTSTTPAFLALTSLVSNEYIFPFYPKKLHPATKRNPSPCNTLECRPKPFLAPPTKRVHPPPPL